MKLCVIYMDRKYDENEKVEIIWFIKWDNKYLEIR